MKWNNNFPISWSYLTKGWCCSFHKNPGMINRKTVAVSVAQYYFMGNTQDQKHSFSIWFNLGISLICFLWNTDFALQIEAPSQNAVLNLPCAQHQFLFIFFPPYFLSSPIFLFSPIFSWLLQDISLSPGIYLLKLCSPEKKIKTLFLKEICAFNSHQKDVGSC